MEKCFLGRFLLPLTHANVGKLLIGDADAVFSSHSFDFWRRVHTWEQHKENRYLLVGLAEGFVYVEWRLLNVSFSHDLTYIRGEC